VNKLLFLFLFTLSAIAHSASLELGAGGITPHFSTSKKNYCNQWNDTSIIVNESYYLSLYGKNLGITYIQGKDSICSPISGFFLHYVMNRSKWSDVGITVGGYEYNLKNWERHAEDTPSDIDAPSTLLVKVGDKTVVPVLALSVGVHLIRSNNWSLKLNNLFTPIIFNHSLAFEYRF